jgi:DNA gyrase subunit A
MSLVDGYDIVADAYSDFGEHVNRHRALPYIFDGLKSVERRLLSACALEGGSSSLVICASIVGTCMGKFHPHGDKPIYETLVRAINKSPSLYIKKGSFGFRGLSPTSAAAMRYTKASSLPGTGRR